VMVLTDGSEGTITANDGTTITCAAGLSGGTNDEWRDGDEWSIEGMTGGGDDEWGGTDSYAFGTDYDIYFNSSDFDLSGLAVRDSIFIGTIPFVFGWKWEDFGSPSYKHQIKGLHVDFEPCGPAWVMIEHATNTIPTVLKRTAHYITPADTKLVSRFNYGKAYTYGWKIRCWAKKRIKIHNVSIEYTTIV